ncbi:PilZ domain-containing protein [Desulfobacterales bacterium HSG2]|nr:PilZ domain-containing protein [Desulfobacterales bacterium HSG2]
MEEKKVFINNYKKASFTCPKCKKRKMLNVAGYRNIQEEVRITHRCSCGNDYTLLLERRMFPRKIVHLPGSYIWKERRKTMIVKDISRGGVKLELETEKGMKIGDRLVIEFCLDDPRQTLIHKEVTVRYERGPCIGVEFRPSKIITSFDRSNDKAIAAYMLGRSS